MVQINGKYQLVSNENLVAYLQSYKIPEDKAKLADSLTPTLDVTIDGKKVSLVSNSTLPNASSHLTLDEEVDEPMPTGVTLKSTAKLSGDSLVISSRTEDSANSGTRTYNFTDAGVTITLVRNPEGITAKRIYKRV